MVAVRAADLVRPAGQQAGGRSALTVAGTGKIRTGDLVAFCKVVLVAWAAGPEPLEELQRAVLGASWDEHDQRDWRAVIIGGLKAAPADGTLIRMPDTPANRAAS